MTSKRCGENLEKEKIFQHTPDKLNTLTRFYQKLLDENKIKIHAKTNFQNLDQTQEVY